jgi:epoxyqueuosine reductase QueG
MSVERAIITQARELFDVAGVTPYGADSLLVLGLVTTPERDLDDFGRSKRGVIQLGGFKAHALPRLQALVDFIRGKGLAASIIGQYGYPQGKELNLKQQAVAAGIGGWGKNSLVIHPRFGPWLRFMAVRVSGVTLPPTNPEGNSRQESPSCQGCTACIDACPLGIIAPYCLRDAGRCLAVFENLPQAGKLVACDLCLAACPYRG